MNDRSCASPDAVEFGLLSDFYFGESVIAFCGTTMSLRKFSDFLRTAARLVPISIELGENELFSGRMSIDIVLKVTEQSFGMRRINERGVYEWQLSREIASDFADLIDEVANQEVPMHQYLDASAEEEIDVVVSTEFDGRIFLREDN